jgi:hypothetical protein
MVIKDLLQCLEEQTHPLLMWITLLKVPAYIIRAERERKLAEAAQKSHSKAASPLGQGLGHRAPAFLPALFHPTAGKWNSRKFTSSIMHGAGPMQQGVFPYP